MGIHTHGMYSTHRALYTIHIRLYIRAFFSVSFTVHAPVSDCRQTARTPEQTASQHRMCVCVHNQPRWGAWCVAGLAVARRACEPVFVHTNKNRRRRRRVSFMRMRAVQRCGVRSVRYESQRTRMLCVSGGRMNGPSLPKAGRFQPASTIALPVTHHRKS